MIKAVVYDLDGTLLNTLTTIAGYGNAAMKKFGFCEFEERKYRYFVGNGAKVLIERMLNEAGAPKDKYFDRIYTYYNEIYDANPLYNTKPYDGIPELVSAVRELGIKQAVLSNKPDFAVKSNIKHFFGETFDKVYGGREGIALKPDPGALFALLDELDAKPDECVYVGDTYVDMKTGKSAGAVTVGVLWGFRDRKELEENNADYIVSEPSEIYTLIKRINNVK